MKRIPLLTALFAFFCLIQACQNRSKDDTQNTDSTSTVTVVDSTKLTDSIAAAHDTLHRDTTPQQPAFKPPTADERFTTTAIDGGITEIVLSKLATRHAVSGKVKAFANMVIADHISTGDKLKAIAKTENIVLPPGPQGPNQTIINRLSEQKGADFDKMYVDLMLNDHQGAISLFEDESKNGDDEALKTFALSTLPMLKKHLTVINSIKNDMK